MNQKMTAVIAMFALTLPLVACVEDDGISSVPPMTEPTANRIPGFNAEDANLTMCSDGGLREDCRDAPLGY